MLREEYYRRLVDEAHVELYLSGTDGARLYWPWRMEPPKEATLSYRNACEKYIIDSDPKDDSVTNEDALDMAFKLDAEVASLQDIYQDKQGTVNKLLDGLSVADEHPYDGALLLPLQAPFVECWEEIGAPKEHWLGIGGLKNASVQARINAAQELRDAVGDDVWIHGFGWGPVDETTREPFALAQVIRDQPNLLDSCDYSTPVRTKPALTNGGEHASVNAMYAGARLIRDLREVTPYPDQVEQSGHQLTWGEFGNEKLDNSEPH